MLGLALSLFVATSLGSDADGLLVSRLSLDGVVAATPGFHFQLEQAALAAEGAPLGAPVARPPSVLAASAGFLAGDALALGTWAVGSALSRRSGEQALGMGFLTIQYTAVAAVLAPPILGVLAASRTTRAPGSARAVLLGGAVHVAGLVAAAVLVRRDHRALAAGLVVAVDLGVAPWLVVRALRAARDTGDSE
jgi:hypothetical protein